MTMTGDHATETTVTFDDLYVLTAEDADGEVDAFVLNWNDEPSPPPYYVWVADRRFAFTGMTFLLRGHGAALPRFVREEEAEGRLAIFVERGERLLGYVHDPAAESEEEDEAAVDAEAAVGPGGQAEGTPEG